METGIGVFTTFCMLVAAVVGTFMLINAPDLSAFDGMSIAEYNKSMREYLDRSGMGTAIRLIVYTITAYVYGFVIEPLVVVTALNRNLGFRPLAYVMGIIAFIWLIDTLTNVFKKKSLSTGKVIYDNVSRELVPVDQTMTVYLPSTRARKIRKVLYSLPTLYLWYLVAIGLGIISG